MAINTSKVEHEHKCWNPKLYSLSSDERVKHAFGVLNECGHTFRSTDAVLDIGSGNGMITAAIASELVPNGYATGIDRSQEMIRFSKDSYKMDNLQFEPMDALEIKYVSQFDVVVSFACFIDPCQFFDEKNYRDLLNQAGFNIKSITEEALYLFQDKEQFELITKGWLPHLTKLPNHLQDEFMKDISGSILGLNLINQAYANFFPLPSCRLVAYVNKSIS